MSGLVGPDRLEAAFVRLNLFRIGEDLYGALDA